MDNTDSEIQLKLSDTQPFTVQSETKGRDDTVDNLEEKYNVEYITVKNEIKSENNPDVYRIEIKTFSCCAVKTEFICNDGVTVKTENNYDDCEDITMKDEIGFPDLLTIKNENLSETEIQYNEEITGNCEIKYEDVMETSNPDMQIKSEEIEIKPEQQDFESSKCKSEEKSIIKDEPKYNPQRHLLIRQNLSVEDTYNCEYYYYVTKKKANIKSHLAMHSPSEEIYRCIYCPFETSTKDCLISHFPSHKDSKSTLFACHQCSFMAKNEYNLKRHQVNHQSVEEVLTYKCEICSYQSNKKDNLKSHGLSHQSPSDTNIYNCESCSFTTKYKRVLKIHKLTRHVPVRLSKMKMCKCANCSYATKTKSNAEMHVPIHRTPSEIELYSCEWCSFKTKLDSELKTHRLTHDAEVFKCGKCPYTTICRRYIEKHVLAHQNTSELTTYKCESCSYATKDERYLRTHMRVHENSWQAKKYSCESCSFETKGKGALKMHELYKHTTGQGPIEIHKCESCPYESERKSSLINHMRSHFKRFKKSL